MRLHTYLHAYWLVYCGSGAINHASVKYYHFRDAIQLVAIVDILGPWCTVLYKEVSLIKKAYLEHSEVSLIQRCPFFREITYYFQLHT